MNNNFVRRFTIVVVLFLLNTYLFADKQAAIILEEKITHHIKSIDNVQSKIYRKIRILNKRGEGYSNIVISENNYIKLKSVKGNITDKAGEKLKKFNKGDFQKTNISDLSILTPEAWNKYFEYQNTSYPYTIEYEYVLQSKSTFYQIHWSPQQDVPILFSQYTLMVDNDFPFKTKAVNIDVEPKVLKNKKTTSYQWQLLAVPERDLEDYMSPEDKVQKVLYFIPEKYKIDDYTGSFESWNDFGNFIKEMAKNRYKLKIPTRQKIQGMTALAENDREKIGILYKYLQEHTRYQAIHLGVGGWQPHYAQDIYNNCYGDCKDLSTLMISMLNVVGIKSYPVLILMRDMGLTNPDIVLSHFNHYISMVPLGTDTLWLENTADYRIAGELSYQDEGCNVLVLKEDSCQFVKTPESKYSDNQWKIIFKGQLNRMGILNFTGEMTLTGNFKISNRSSFNNRKKDEIQTWVSHQLGSYVPDVRIDEISVFNVKYNFEKPIIIKFKGAFTKFGNKSGNRIFINPNIFSRYDPDDLPKERVEDRNYPLYSKFARSIVDSIQIMLPPSYTVEALPQNIGIKKDFATYQMDYNITDHKLNFTRRYERIQKVIPIEKYEDRILMVKKMIKGDKAKIVFKK